jgi:CheY-like chemotaxis protein
MATNQPFVAVVDDDPSIAKSLARLLGAYGYKVQTFASPKNFLDTFPAEAPQCLVLDVHMPEMTGFELHDQLATQGARVPAIFMTAFDTPQTRARARRPGCFGLLMKPFDNDALLGAIEEAMKSQPPELQEMKETMAPNAAAPVGMEIRAEEFQQNGLYLLFPGGRRIVLTREKVEAFALTFEANLDQIPAEIRGAAAFHACAVCPERDHAKFCHALPATLAFVEELKGFKSFDNVTAVYKGSGQGLVLVPKITMQEALQFVAMLSLLLYCEVGKKYWKYFLGIHPLLSQEEMVTRIQLNIYWDCRGAEEKIDAVLLDFENEITCTCRCQVQRLGLISTDDALKNAFVNTLAQIQWLAMNKGDVIAQAFEEFKQTGRGRLGCAN